MPIKVEPEQPGVTAQVFFHSGKMSLDIKISDDVGTSQIGEFFESSPKKLQSSSFLVDSDLKPLEVRFETPQYWFEFDTSMRPWLPQSIMDLLGKMRRQVLSTQEAVRLMRGLGERASEHYGLKQGQFAAITFNGRIVELADTKLELLKKVQGMRYSEQIFVWEIGSESFTGWKW